MEFRDMFTNNLILKLYLKSLKTDNKIQKAWSYWLVTFWKIMWRKYVYLLSKLRRLELFGAPTPL